MSDLVLTPKTIFKRNDEILVSKVDDDLVMMDVANGRYFGLDSVGASLWGQLDEARSMEELTNNLCTVYQVSTEQCSRDIEPFLKMLLEKGLITVS